MSPAKSPLLGLLFPGECGIEPQHFIERAGAVAVPVFLTGCDGRASALDAAGATAADISQLFWWMIAGAIAVWLFVMFAAVYAVRAVPDDGSVRRGQRLIVFGGIALPLVLLSGLLFAGLRQLPRMTAPGDGLVIDVTGERWWWRVRYELPGGRAVMTANEIRMPADERVLFRLAATDVIHSFWIPSLGGKMDMVPGRVNRLVLDATQVGEFRGVCAEFCGLSHALMEFDVIVMQRPAFDRWLERQAQDALPPASAEAEKGLRLFRTNGCGACHTVSGTRATGSVGPDLTHVGSRLSIAAGTLEATPESFARWIGHTTEIKSGVLMPPYPMLDRDERLAIGIYLAGLE